MRTRPGWVESEIYFRIVHAARGGHSGAPMAAYREQRVEIALGPKGAFENGNIGALTRRVSGDRTVSAVLQVRGNPKPPREPQTPRVAELLRKAIEWRRQLDTGEVPESGRHCPQGGSHTRTCHPSSGSAWSGP